MGKKRTDFEVSSGDSLVSSASRLLLVSSLRPSVRNTTALIERLDTELRISSYAAPALVYSAVPPSGVSAEMAERSAALFAPMVRNGTSLRYGWASLLSRVENDHSATSSLGPNWSSARSAAAFAVSSLLLPFPASALIEREVSMTSSTRAGLRC